MAKLVFQNASFPVLVREAAREAGIELDIRGTVAQQKSVLDFLTGGPDEMEIVVRADEADRSRIQNEILPRLLGIGRPCELVIPASDVDVIRIREKRVGQPDDPQIPVLLQKHRPLPETAAVRDAAPPEWQRTWGNFLYGLAGSHGRYPFLKGCVRTKEGHLGLGLVAGEGAPSADFLVEFFTRVQDGRANAGHRQMLSTAAPKSFQTLTFELDNSGKLELLCHGFRPLYFRSKMLRPIVPASQNTTFSARIQMRADDLLLVPGFRLAASEVAELDTLCRDAESGRALEERIVSRISYLGRGRCLLLRFSPHA